jgi:hypothetical protein
VKAASCCLFGEHSARPYHYRDVRPFTPRIVLLWAVRSFFELDLPKKQIGHPPPQPRIFELDPQRIQAEPTDLIATKPEVILWHVGCHCSDFANVSESSQVDVI